VGNAYAHIASLGAITPQHRLWFGSAFASCCGWAEGKKPMVPGADSIRSNNALILPHNLKVMRSRYPYRYPHRRGQRWCTMEHRLPMQPLGSRWSQAIFPATPCEGRCHQDREHAGQNGDHCPRSPPSAQSSTHRRAHVDLGLSKDEARR